MNDLYNSREGRDINYRNAKNRGKPRRDGGSVDVRKLNRPPKKIFAGAWERWISAACGAAVVRLAAQVVGVDHVARRARGPAGRRINATDPSSHCASGALRTLADFSAGRPLTSLADTSIEGQQRRSIAMLGIRPAAGGRANGHASARPPLAAIAAGVLVQEAFDKDMEPAAGI